MRDAELRFETLRMRIEEHAWTTRGEELAVLDVLLRHPGERQDPDLADPADGAEGSYEVWLSDGDHGPDVRRFAQARDPAPVRPIVRRPDGRDLPGRSRVYRPGHAAADGVAAGPVRPPRRATARTCSGPALRRDRDDRVAGREAIVLECDHPRTDRGGRGPARTSRMRIAVDRLDGVILRLEESDRRPVTRDAIVTDLPAERAAAAVGVRVHVPVGHDLHLLGRASPSRRRGDRPARPRRSRRRWRGR